MTFILSLLQYLIYIYMNNRNFKEKYKHNIIILSFRIYHNINLVLRKMYI